MEVEVFNKRNKTIQAITDARVATMVLNPTKGNLSFNGGCVEVAKLMIGRYIHIVKMHNVWGFIVNDDNTGYKLWKPDPKHDFLYVSSIPLAKHIASQLNVKTSVRYYVQATKTEFQGHAFFEILVHMPLHPRHKKRKAIV